MPPTWNSCRNDFRRHQPISEQPRVRRFLLGVVADPHTAEPVEVGEHALPKPALSGEPGTMLDAPTGDQRLHAETSGQPTVSVVVATAPSSITAGRRRGRPRLPRTPAAQPASAIGAGRPDRPRRRARLRVRRRGRTTDVSLRLHGPGHQCPERRSDAEAFGHSMGRVGSMCSSHSQGSGTVRASAGQFGRRSGRGVCQPDTRTTASTTGTLGERGVRHCRSRVGGVSTHCQSAPARLSAGSAEAIRQ